MLNSCSRQEKQIENEVSTPVVNEEVSIDESLFNIKVNPVSESSLYKIINDEFVEVGIAYPGFNIDLGNEGFQDYIKVKDSDYYINVSDIAKSERWYEKRNNLIAFNQNIKTKENYGLYDIKGNLVAKMLVGDEYPIYIQKNDDNRYGVLFQNEILYINESEVDSIYDNQNTAAEYGDEISVLMYHFFYSEENGEKRKDVNFVEVNEFDEQLDSLSNNGFATLSMIEVYEFVKGRANIPLNSVAITIDDGDPSVYKYAYQIIKEHHMNATLFLITGQEDPTLSYDYIMMREDGLELQSHSWQMHQGGCSGMGHGGRLLCTDYETGVLDTKMSMDYVDGGFVYCYPFGDVNEHAKNIVSDGGAKMAFTTANGKVKQGMDLLELPRVRVSGGNSIDSFMSSIY